MLYKVCCYLIEHIEKYKEFAIYEYKDQCNLVEEGILTKNEVIMTLHNRLLAQFKFLIGEGENRPNQIDPKGSEIVPKIDYQSLKEKNLAKMLVITDNFINKDDNENRMRVNYQMFKINVDKTIPMMDYLIEQIFPLNELSELGQWREKLKRKGVKNVPERQEYFKILEIKICIFIQ